MAEDAIPFNKVGVDAPEGTADLAEREGITEEEWRAKNLPASKLEFRWRYTNKTIHLYERRLRSLRSFSVGPAVQAWVRSRLEWIRDNKFYEMPDGVLVLTIDPEGVVDIEQVQIEDAPAFTREMLEKCDVPGTLWAFKDGILTAGGSIERAADTFVRDLASTLGYEVAIGQVDFDSPEVFAVSDEFGLIALEGVEGEITSKLAGCFDKLWNLKK